MPLLGAHMSIAGGYYKAVRAAADLGMDCVQIFTKNNNQWKGKTLAETDIAKFKEAIKETGIQAPCSHDSYLINLASPKDELWEKSREAMVIELERAEALGLIGVVMHPGSYVESSEEKGLKRIVKALNQVIRETKGFEVEIWLEATAGQGTNLGHRFEHLQYIIDHLKDNARVGVCIDTCHIFAAGYALETKQQYQKTMDEFDKLIGIDRIRSFHLNDSKKEFGSRVDRHEQIGEGFLGLKPFKHILNDPRFKTIPMYMETPKGETDGEAWDSINLNKLRKMIKKTTRK